MVARVLIVDPDREITDLFAHSVKRLGHVPLHWDEATTVDGVEADVALVEPARPRALGGAPPPRTAPPRRGARGVQGRSRGGPDQELGAVAHLDKPFERRELERALDAALTAEAA